MANSYLRKVLPAEAEQFTGGELQAAEIDVWLDIWGDVRWKIERFREADEPMYSNDDAEGLIPVIHIPEHLMIITDQGNFHVALNNWIVKEAEGTMRILTDEVFHSVYEQTSTERV